MKAIITMIIALAGHSVFAAPTAGDITPEQRKQMAEMHTKAAECLNSNKSMQECRDEMRKSMPHMGMGKGMGEQWGCPMMGSAEQPQSDTKTKTKK